VSSLEQALELLHIKVRDSLLEALNQETGTFSTYF